MTLVEEVQPINFGMTENPQIKFLVVSLDSKEEKKIVAFLGDQKINFVWSHADILGLDTSLAIHHLTIYHEAKPTK